MDEMRGNKRGTLAKSDKDNSRDVSKDKTTVKKGKGKTDSKNKSKK